MRPSRCAAQGGGGGDSITYIRSLGYPQVSFAVTAGPGRVVGAHNGDPALQVRADRGCGFSGAVHSRLAFLLNRICPRAPLRQAPPHAPYVPAYHGLARAVVQVSGRGRGRGIIATWKPPCKPHSLLSSAGDSGFSRGAVDGPVDPRRPRASTGTFWVIVNGTHHCFHAPLTAPASSIVAPQLVNVDAGAAPSSSGVVPIPAGTAPPVITVTASSPGLPTVTVTLNTSVAWDDSVLAVAAANVGTAYIGE